MAAIFATSSGVAGSLRAPRSPITKVRTAQCGTCAATSIACGRRSSTSRYCGKLSQSQLMPSCRAVPGISSTSSITAINASCASGVALQGANPTPQLPITSVVTPWFEAGESSGSQVAWPSIWVCTSTQPGVTSLPVASISRRPRPSILPRAAIFPDCTATSPTNAGAPLPSTMRPLRTTRSNSTYCSRRHPGID